MIEIYKERLAALEDKLSIAESRGFLMEARAERAENQLQQLQSNWRDTAIALIDERETHGDISIDPSHFLPEVTVYPAMEDRAYGGPEEGGWWYNYTIPIERQPLVMRLDLAIRYVRRANVVTDHFINSHRRDISSMRSEGRVTWLWTWDDVPKPTPERTPHYE